MYNSYSATVVYNMINMSERKLNPVLIIKGNQIEHVNNSFISTFGKTKKDYISKSLNEVIPVEIISVFEEILQDHNKIKDLKINGKRYSISSFIVKKTEEDDEEERVGIMLQLIV